MKKYSWLLTLLLVAALLALLPVYAFAAEVEAIPLTPDTETIVEITEGGQSAWLSFTPTQSGAYILQSFADEDTVVKLYDADMEELFSDDDGGVDNNFSLFYTLEMGKTYYYEVYLWDENATGQIPMMFIINPVKSLQIDTVTLIENGKGYRDVCWDPEKDEEVEYFCYEYLDALTGTATFIDNSTAEIEGETIAYGDWRLRLEVTDDQGSGEIWTVGNTYEATVILGEMSQTVPVTIVPSPVKKVEVQPITLYGDVDGRMNGESFGEPFFHYDWVSRMVATVTYVDGSTYTTQPGDQHVEYQGQRYEIDMTEGQSSENLWQPGYTYTEEITVLGVTAPVSVTIKGNLIKSIQTGDVTVVEGIHGYWEVAWDDDTEAEVSYFYYSWLDEVDDLTVTFTDNTVFTGSLTEFEETYGIEATLVDTQSLQTPWSVGNTYDVSLHIGTHEVSLKVTVEPSPIKSVHVEPVIMAESNEGYYYWSDHLLYTITFRDGTTVRSDAGGFAYQDEYFWPEWWDGQDENSWGIGTHTATVELVGKEYEVSVYIAEEKTSGSYTYVLYNSKAYICDSRTGYTTLTLPTTLGSYTVAGLVQLGQDLETVKNLTLPNSYTYLGPSAFWHRDYDSILEKLTVGTGIQYFSAYAMYGTELKEVTVKSGNANFCSTDGVVYDKAKTRLVFYPWNKTDSHTIPNTVTDIESLVKERASVANLDVTLGTGTKDQYVQEGDFVFTKDKKKLVFCNSTVTGSYTLPTSVTDLGIGAFSNTGFTSVTLHDGITYLPQAAFYNSTALTKVTLPKELEGIPYQSFAKCASLKSIQIPQGAYYIDYGVFMGSGLTAVVIPDTMEYIYPYAFQNCPLTDVYYGGSEADWNKIEIEEASNKPLLDATFHFNGETAEGDLDGDYRKTTDDAVYLLLSVMFGTEDYPVPAGVSLDFDNSGKVTTDDAVYLLLNVMFGDEDYPI